LSNTRPAPRRRLLPLTGLALSMGLAASCLGAFPGGVGSGGGSLGPGLKIDNGEVGRAPANGRTLLAIYLMGSDLEDDLKPRDDIADEQQNGVPVSTGAGSSDLREIIEGYSSLSASEQANTDVLIAMGGARKKGWQGIKYLDMPTLLADAKDNQFGNDGPYLATDPKADMGAESTFKAFLAQVQQRSGGAGKVIVDLWDHGGSYLGLGPDTNNMRARSGGMLTVTAMKSALAATSFKADVIGFDACLMGSVEVAQAVKGSFDYLVASEETEPGHGWDYTPILRFLGTQPTATAVGLGKAMVDGFLDSPKHQGTKGRTLSVVDLRQVPAMAGAIDTLATRFGANLKVAYPTVLAASGQTERFGATGKGGTEYALDVTHFAENIQSSSPESAADVAAMRAALGKAVIYARSTGDKPHSQGISIFSPVNTKFFDRRLYHEGNAASATWLGFIRGFRAAGDADTRGPSISNQQPLATKALATQGWRSAFGLAQLNASAPGVIPDGSFTMTVTDDVGLKQVSAMNVLQPDPKRNRYQVIASDRQTPQSPGTYVLQGWDGQAIHLTDSQGTSVLLPLSYESTTTNGTTLYTAPARVNGAEVTLYLAWDKAKGTAVDHWLVPFAPSQSDDSTVVQKLQYPLAAGDKVSFYHSYVDTDADARTAELSPEVTLGGGLAWKQVRVAGQKLYFMFAEDLKGNVKASDLHLVIDPLAFEVSGEPR
jgi:hypothetical protein